MILIRSGPEDKTIVSFFKNRTRKVPRTRTLENEITNRRSLRTCTTLRKLTWRNQNKHHISYLKFPRLKSAVFSYLHPSFLMHKHVKYGIVRHGCWDTFRLGFPKRAKSFAEDLPEQKACSISVEREKIFFRTSKVFTSKISHKDRTTTQ